MPIAQEFASHLLNHTGLERAGKIAQAFNDLVIALDLPEGRQRSIVMTKLEEACFFAKKAIAVRPENQAPQD